jgi:hypothetical protein
MNSIVREITKRVVAMVMMTAIGVLVINTGLFTHTHQFADGSIVTHAHPYNKSAEQSPGESHRHTQTELLFLQTLGLLFFMALSFAAIILLSKKVEFLIDYKDQFSLPPVFLKNGRAPPLFNPS